MRSFFFAAGATAIGFAIVLLGIHHHTSGYDPLIRQAAARNGLDFYLVKALIHEESWFRPDIRGTAGEFGLMQITKAAAADFSANKGLPQLQEERLLEPELNLEIGCWYLHRSLERYRDSPHPELFALLRYNAGESRSDHWLKLATSSSIAAGASREDYCLSFVDFPTTRTYARKILKRARTRNFWR